jgi:hypothetical protein
MIPSYDGIRIQKNKLPNNWETTKAKPYLSGLFVTPEALTKV